MATTKGRKGKKATSRTAKKAVDLKGYKRVTDDSKPEPLEYSEGEVIEGVLGRATKGQYGLNQTILVDGKKFWLPNHARLADSILGLPQGTRVALVYQGEEDIGRGHPIQLWDAFVAESDGAEDDLPF